MRRALPCPSGSGDTSLRCLGFAGRSFTKTFAMTRPPSEVVTSRRSPISPLVIHGPFVYFMVLVLICGVFCVLVSLGDCYRAQLILCFLQGVPFLAVACIAKW